MKAWAFRKKQHFKKIMPVWILHTKMTIGIKNLYLKLVSAAAGCTEILQTVNWYLLFVFFYLFQIQFFIGVEFKPMSLTVQENR